MGHFLRSEDMELVQLILPSESVFTAVSEIGEMGIVQFKDLNPDANPFQRSFVKEVRQCEEMERRLRVFVKQMGHFGISEDSLLGFQCENNYPVPSQSELDDLNEQLLRLESEVMELSDNQLELRNNFLELTELSFILRETSEFFVKAAQYDFGSANSSYDDIESLQQANNTSKSIALGFLTGIIHREKFPAFERVLWRGCRGNAFVQSADIGVPLTDPVTREDVHKVAFTIFFQGSVLENKIKRICDGFGCSLYACPESVEDREDLMKRVGSSLKDLHLVLQRTDEYRSRVLGDVACQYEEWAVKVKKAKTVYFTMNLFNYDVTNSALIAEGWCPTDQLDKLDFQKRQSRATMDSSAPIICRTIPTKEMPPTLNRTNKYTSCMQTLVNAYGVAQYKEINPALFSMISFPFLFAVMFGDIGHGFLMTMCALYVIYQEKWYTTQKNLGEIVDNLVAGRYLILMMGIFSMYTGVLYNDCFSKHVFVNEYTAWQLSNTSAESVTLPFHVRTDENCPDGCGYTGTPYPFGIDPIWGITSNHLTFTNSLKMKTSILLGVSHMMFGIFISFLNAKHKKDLIGVFGEFIPQVLFLGGLFGYLSILIVFKWSYEWDSEKGADPSLMAVLINMVLNPMNGITAKDHTIVYGGQKEIQLVLLFLCFVSAPTMLLARPMIGNYLHKKRIAAGYVPVANNEDEADHGGHGHGDGEFDFGDVFIHQAIHTIEFCLGAVSNTASYLRLWALSLAHAQLSDVLWTMLLRNCFGSALTLFVGFPVWAILTISILLLMEGMSAFLHALRLHWVEFMSKFYAGGGIEFAPFQFSALFDEVDA